MARHTERSIHSITLADFDEHPVWMDYEDDDDVLVAWAGPVDLAEGVWFVRAALALRGGAVLAGYVRVRDGVVTLVEAWADGAGFVGYPLIPGVREAVGESPETFAAALGRTAGEVFPLRCRIDAGSVRAEVIVAGDDEVRLAR